MRSVGAIEAQPWFVLRFYFEYAENEDTVIPRPDFPSQFESASFVFWFGIQDIKKDARFPSRLSGMQAVMLWVSNLSGKDNRALILKNFLLAWARVAQFALQKLSVY